MFTQNIYSSGKECIKGSRDSKNYPQSLGDTHSCEDVQALVKLNKTLDETVATFKHALPNTEGLIIRKEAACKATAKFKALKLQKVVEKEGFGSLKLYTRRGRKRLDSSYRNRVGQRAARLRKVFSSLGRINVENIMCYNVTGSKSPCHQQHEEAFKPQTSQPVSTNGHS